MVCCILDTTCSMRYGAWDVAHGVAQCAAQPQRLLTNNEVRKTFSSRSQRVDLHIATENSNATLTTQQQQQQQQRKEQQLWQCLGKFGVENEWCDTLVTLKWTGRVVVGAKQRVTTPNNRWQTRSFDNHHSTPPHSFIFVMEMCCTLCNVDWLTDLWQSVKIWVLTAMFLERMTMLFMTSQRSTHCHQLSYPTSPSPDRVVCVCVCVGSDCNLRRKLLAMWRSKSPYLCKT